MSFTLLEIAVGLALIDWLAVARRWKPVEFFAKPGVMIALLAWLAFSVDIQGALVWFALALAFSMAGDVFLMLPREQFIPGLVSFLLAHLAYLIGFNQTRPPLNLASLALAVIVGLTGWRIFRRIAAGLDASGQGSLKTPVLIYTLVIGLMLLSALLTLVRPDEQWATGPALLVSLGAFLFFLSDTFLAWGKFVQTVAYGKLIVITSYHIGQILILLGAVTHFASPV
jgi:uncharacterized membrane protein YhhN